MNFAVLNFSRSTISELCKNLDPIVQGWISRPLNEKRFPFIIVDAMVIKGKGRRESSAKRVINCHWDK